VRVVLIALVGAGFASASADADVLPPQIHTMAGGGRCSGLMTYGGPCDGVSATAVPISTARSVAALPDGGFLYIDAGNDLVREVSPSGIVSTVAGDGFTTDAPDGTLAVNSGLNGPVAVAPLPDGGFLITEYNGSVVRVVSPGPPTTATITTIAGTGAPGANQQLDGPATSIPLNYPADAEPTSDGRVLIADTYNNVIRVVSAPTAGATMSTIAGGGACADVTAACDGMPAAGVSLYHPASVSPIQGGAGGYLIAEYDNAAIRQVSEVAASGIFTTVAGVAGDPGFGGDGGPATSALLDHPEQVASLPSGGFLIADTDNERIRMVSSSGTITTVAGDGIASTGGDGGAATDAFLQGPASVSVTPGGGYLIADAHNNVIRGITYAPTTTITLASGRALGRNGWYVFPVTATVSTTENGTIHCVLDPPQAPTLFDEIPPSCSFASSTGDYISGANGTHTLYAASVNSFGDKELPVSVTLKIDQTPPALHCRGTPSFTFGARRARVAASVSDSVSGPVAKVVFARANTSRVGDQTATVRGENKAGLVGFATCHYTVLPLTLHPSPSIVSTFRPHGRRTKLVRLAVRHVPAGAAVNVSCRGRGCPFSAARGVTGKVCHGRPCHTIAPIRPKGPRTVTLTALVASHSLTAGTTLTVSVTKPNSIGRVWSFTIVRGGQPVQKVSCLEPGMTIPGRGCTAR
jgi:hypothetical protein